MFKPIQNGDVSKDGYGLDLSTCMSIVEKHNGIICLDQSYLNGTAFTLRLPVWQEC